MQPFFLEAGNKRISNSAAQVLTGPHCSGQFRTVRNMAETYFIGHVCFKPSLCVLIKALEPICLP